MNKQNRVPIDPELLDIVNGGSFGFSPDDHGTYSMYCQYSGQMFYNVKLSDIIEIGKYGAYLQDTPEDEQKIIAWAMQQGYIQ